MISPIRMGLWNKFICHCERLKGAKQSNGQFIKLIVCEIASSLALLAMTISCLKF